MQARGFAGAFDMPSCVVNPVLACMCSNSTFPRAAFMIVLLTDRVLFCYINIFRFHSDSVNFDQGVFAFIPRNCKRRSVVQWTPERSLQVLFEIF